MSPTPRQIAAVFGCDTDQVRAQFAKNARQLGAMAEKARRTARKVNGFTSVELQTLTTRAAAKSAK